MAIYICKHPKNAFAMYVKGKIELGVGVEQHKAT